MEPRPHPHSERFELLTLLGRGGMGEVYEALDRERQMHVALKMVREVSAARRLRLKAEFRTLAAVEHRNIVALYDLVAHADELFFTMELVNGEDLRSHVVRPTSPVLAETLGSLDTAASFGSRDPLTAATCASMPTGSRLRPATRPPPPRHSFAEHVDVDRLRAAFSQLAGALDALHERGIVHCDVKPSNVMVERTGRVVVLDFGISAPTRGDERESTDETAPRSYAGTPIYMAPEQARGAASPAADWYALGVMLHEAIAGSPPFVGSAELVLAAKDAFATPPLRSLVHDAPAELATLCDALLAREPAQRPAARDVLQVLGAKVRTRAAPVTDLFVGRQSELAALRDAHARAGRRAAAAVISGPSGIGKTRLARRLLAALTGDGTLVLRGRCHEREQVPYNAFDALIDGIAAQLQALDDERRRALLPADTPQLARLFPVLAPFAGDAPARELVPADQARLRASAALAQLLAGLARQRPVIAFVDDLQWADRDSLELLLELVTPPASPLFWLLTVRDEHLGDDTPLTRALAVLAERIPTRAVVVPPLSSTERRELAVSLSGELRAPRTSQLSWLADTGGNPMLITELARYATRTEDRRTGPEQSFIDEILLRRIAALEPGDRRVVELTAVAGQPTPVSALARALGVTGADAARSVRRLSLEGLVRTAESGTEPRVVSYHDRVREAITGALPIEALAAYHRSLAEALELSASERADRLGHHWLAAGEPERARPLLLRAATAAQDQLAFDRAAALYRRVLDACALADATRAELFATLAYCLGNVGRTRDAATAYLDAARLATDDDRLELERQAAEQLLIGGHIEEGIAATRRVLDAVGLRLPKTSAGAIPGLIRHQLRMRMTRPRLATSAPDATRALATRRADICWSVGCGLGMVDSLRGVLFMFEATRRSLALGDPLRAARSCFGTGGVLAAMGARELGDRLIEISEAAARTAADPLVRFYGRLGALCRAYTPRCQWQAVVEGAADALRLWSEAGRERGWEIDSADQFIAWSRAYLGDLPAMEQRVGELVRSARMTGNRYLELGLRARLVLVHLMHDAPDEALADSEEAVAAWLPGSRAFQMQHYLGFVGQCEALAYAERGQPTETLARQWRSMRRFPLQLGRIEGMHGRARLGLLEARERAGWRRRWLLRRIDRLAHAIGRHQPVVAPAFRDLLLAGTAHLRGDADTERARLEAAIASLDALDTRLYAAAARRRLGQILGGDEGAALIRAADAFMAERAIARPERMAAMLAPPWSS